MGEVRAVGVQGPSWDAIRRNLRVACERNSGVDATSDPHAAALCRPRLRSPFVLLAADPEAPLDGPLGGDVDASFVEPVGEGVHDVAGPAGKSEIGRAHV